MSAAYLKFRDMTWEPFGKAVFIPPRLRVIFIESEAILGVWLLTGFARRLLWSVSTLYFTALAGVSAYLVIHGEPTCGCFGQATVNPWVTFGIDAAAVTALAVTRPRVRPAVGTSQAACDGTGRTIALWAGVAILAVVVVEVFRFGGVAPAWDSLTAQRVVVEPALAEIGSGTAGGTAIFTVTLQNRSDQVVQVIGGTNNCVGTTALDLPVTIPAGESRPVRVQGYFRGTPGLFVREYSFITHQDVAGFVTARFAGTIVPKQ